MVGFPRKLKGFTAMVFGKVFYKAGIFLISMWSWLLVWAIGFGFGMTSGVGMPRLKTMFSVLFACSSSRDASLASCLTNSGVNEGRVWNITFIRDFNDWEVKEVLLFSTSFTLESQLLLI